jgi:5-methylcytosine-specific restriction enzyme A
MRQRLFSEGPLCRLCLAQSPEVVAIATISDHIIPLAEGGADDETMFSRSAAPAPMQRAAREATRGRRRAS